MLMHINKTKWAIAVCSAMLFAACNNSGDKSGNAQGTASQKGDILIANMDTTVNPADDFFQSAVGGWLKKNPIPGDETSWGIAHLVNDELYLRKRTINEEALKKEKRSGVDQQVADFWATGMDSATIEGAGSAPLKEE